MKLGVMCMNIKELAKICGVSVATISRVINTPEKVKKETRDSVKEAIEKYGYTPDVIAKSLRKKKTGIYSIVFSVNPEKVFDESYSQKLMKGILGYFTEKDLKLMVDAHKDKNIVRYYENVIKSNIIDGFILLDLLENDERIEYLNSINFPFVVVGRNSKNNFHYVDSDNSAGGYIAVEHLKNIGCKNILFINGQENNPVSVQRLDGVIRAQKILGVNVFSEYGDWDEKKALEITEKYLGKIDGIFCASDNMALEILKRINREKLSIPVIGFDNLAYSDFVGLSTIDQNIYEIGFNAAKTVHKISGGIKVNSVVVPVELIKRESTEKIKGAY